MATLTRKLPVLPADILVVATATPIYAQTFPHMEEVKVIKDAVPLKKKRPPFTCRYMHGRIFFEPTIVEENSYNVSLTDGCLTLAKPDEPKKEALPPSGLIPRVPQNVAQRCPRHANVDQMSRSSHSDEERGLYDLPERFQILRLDSGSVSERRDDTYIKGLLKMNKKKCLYALGYIVSIILFALSFPLARHLFV